MTPFLFATGIENSYPTIRNGTHRVDEMETCGHYRHWRRDFELLRELGLSVLRYGPPLHRTFLGQGRYDWEFADLTFAALKEQDVTPIADLCHFGVPDWIGNFQNPDFPDLFAGYARDFALRYPWIQLYTPVNEMQVCAAVFGLARLVERTVAGRHRVRHGPQAHRQGQRAGHARYPGCAARRDVHPERMHRIQPRQEPGGDRQGGSCERSAGFSRSTSTMATGSISSVYQFLHRQRHDARRIRVFPDTQPPAPLHHGQ